MSESVNFKKHIVLTQAQYDARKAAGTLEAGVIYCISDYTPATKYLHNIMMWSSDDSSYIYFQLLSSTSAAFTTVAQIKAAMGDGTTLPCTGHVNSDDYMAASVFYDTDTSNNLQVEYYNASEPTWTTASVEAFSFQDTVM